MGHAFVLPWEVARHLHSLWIIPVGLINQEYCHPHLIYDYTWSRLNVAVLCDALLDPMKFRQATPRLIRHIFQVNPVLGPLFLSKVKISDAYMRICFHPKYIPCLDFIVLTCPSYTDYLIIFHFYPSMGHFDSAPYF